MRPSGITLCDIKYKPVEQADGTILSSSLLTRLTLHSRVDYRVDVITLRTHENLNANHARENIATIEIQH